MSKHLGRRLVFGLECFLNDRSLHQPCFFFLYPGKNEEKKKTGEEKDTGISGCTLLFSDL